MHRCYDLIGAGRVVRACIRIGIADDHMILVVVFKHPNFIRTRCIQGEVHTLPGLDCGFIRRETNAVVLRFIHRKHRGSLKLVFIGHISICTGRDDHPIRHSGGEFGCRNPVCTGFIDVHVIASVPILIPDMDIIPFRMLGLREGDFQEIAADDRGLADLRGDPSALAQAFKGQRHNVADAAPGKAAGIPVPVTPVKVRGFPGCFPIIGLGIQITCSCFTGCPRPFDGIACFIGPVPSVKYPDRRCIIRLCCNPVLFADIRIAGVIFAIDIEADLAVHTSDDSHPDIMELQLIIAGTAHVDIEAIRMVPFQVRRRNPNGAVRAEHRLPVYRVRPFSCLRIIIVISAACAFIPFKPVDLITPVCFIPGMCIDIGYARRNFNHEILMFGNGDRENRRVHRQAGDPDGCTQPGILPFIGPHLCIQFQNICSALLESEPVAFCKAPAPGLHDPDVLPGPALFLIDGHSQRICVWDIQAEGDFFHGLRARRSKAHSGTRRLSHHKFIGYLGRHPSVSIRFHIQGVGFRARFNVGGRDQDPVNAVPVIPSAEPLVIDCVIRCCGDVQAFIGADCLNVFQGDFE